jgi:DNA-binding FadR family transcriptional regulator
LADATHNRLMIEIYRTITLARELAEWGEMKRRSITPERRAAYEREHREIAEALQLRDIARAEAALTGHLVNIRQNLLGS